MSYAGKDPRSRRTVGAADRTASAFQRGRAGTGAVEREISITRRGTIPAEGLSSREDAELDWQHIGIFAAGALLGAALGAGTALLLAPQSGREARHGLARRGRHLTERTSDAWTDLRDELRYAARRSKRKLTRRLQRARRERRSRREMQEGAGLADD
jgi:gas vesicle protein